MSKKTMSKKEIDRMMKNEYIMWKNEANQRYTTLNQIISYQNKVKQKPLWVQFEQNWIDDNIVQLMDLMGSDAMWKCVLDSDDIKISGISKRTSTRVLQKNIATHKAEANFAGDRNTGGHWYSRKKNDIKFFNSYDEYQINGTNLWCQTFALMNVCDRLPYIFPKKSIGKYYYYNYQALLFIQESIQKCKNKIYKDIIDECLKYPNICLNAIEIDKNFVNIANDGNYIFPTEQRIKNDFRQVKQSLSKQNNSNSKKILNPTTGRYVLRSSTVVKSLNL